jgi:hypothetical protein
LFGGLVAVAGGGRYAMRRGWFWPVVALNFLAIVYKVSARHDLNGAFVYLQGIMAGIGLMFLASDRSPRLSVWPVGITIGVLAVLLAAAIR